MMVARNEKPVTDMQRRKRKESKYITRSQQTGKESKDQRKSTETITK